MPIANYIRETMNSKGASVIRKMFEEGAQLKAQFGEDNVFDFSIGNPDLEPPKEVTDYIQKVANEETKGCHGYMPNAGYMSTRQAMADKVAQEQGCEITGKHVVMSVGAAAALNVVFKSILTGGRDMDKFAASGLTAAFADCGAPYVSEGELVLVCRKLYAQDMTEESFLDKEVMEKSYPEKDYHRMYVGEIVEAYRRV